MKKTVFVILALCIFSQASFAFLFSDDFSNKIAKCTPVDNTNKFTTDGTIYGVENQKCHMKLGGKITNDKTGETVSVENCYIPMSELDRLSFLSKKTTNFFKTYINAKSIPSAEQKEMEKSLEELFGIYKRNCK